MKAIVIYGAGGFGREVEQIIIDLQRAGEPWRFLGFLDEDERRHGTSLNGTPVLGGIEWLDDHPEVFVVVAMGNPAIRRRVIHQVEARGRGQYPVLIHPQAWVGQRVEIASGSIICCGVRVTVDVRIGKHTILNLDSTIGHDAKIGAYSTINPGVNISGNVTLGEGVELGTNSSIIQGVAIHDWATIGAGAAVVNDIPANVVAVGVPAKPIKNREAGWHESA